MTDHLRNSDVADTPNQDSRPTQHAYVGSGMQAFLRSALPWVSALVAVMGLILVLGSVPSNIGWIAWPSSQVASGAAMLIGGLTTLIAQLGLETVLDKRAGVLESARRDNRSRVYEDVLGHIIGSFGPRGSNALTEAQVRSRAVAWASTSVMSALTDWFRYANAHSGVSAQPEDLADRYELVHRVVCAMRSDIGAEHVTKNGMLCMLFEMYDPLSDNPTCVRKGVVQMTGEFLRPSSEASQLTVQTKYLAVEVE